MAKKLIKNIARKMGIEITKINSSLPVDMENDFIQLYNQCKPFTMTSIDRMYALYKSIEYICKKNIDGDMAECGVWKGGSSMLMALTLIKSNASNRKIILYDTYEGMSKPTKYDVDIHGIQADKQLSNQKKNNDVNSIWCYETINEVKKNLYSTGYPKENLQFVKGKVEHTIPANIPNSLSLLRLDTDWYESTKHELIHLYPLLVKHGVLIIDDYGHWQGAQKAVDEYFSKDNFLLLNRIDYTGRIAIKC